MEYEVKFKIDKSGPIIAKLKKIRAEDLGRRKEIDIYMQSGEKAVRLRKLGCRGMLTLKSLVCKKTRAKVRKETEVNFDNADTLIEIFKRLGFSEIKRKEKIRHTFRLGKALVLLDRLPFMGYFVELEGSSEKGIKTTAEILGFDYKKASGASYEDLFLAYYIKHAKKFKDIKIKIIPTFGSEREFKKSPFHSLLNLLKPN